MCRSTRFSLALVTMALFSHSAAARAQSDGVELEWKFEKGQQLSLEMEQSMNLQVQVADNTVETKNVTKTWITWECQDIDKDGNFAIDSTIDRMVMDMQSPMGKARLDTDEEQDEGTAAMIGQSVRPMIGVTMKQTLNSQGKVLKVDLPEQMIASAGKMGGAGMGGMLKDMSKQAALEFPAKPLRVGDTWVVESESASPAGKIAISKTYTYQGVVGEEAKPLHHFDVNVQMKFVEPPQGATIEITDQSTKGNIYFDAAVGRVDHSEVEQVAEFKINVGQQEMDQVLTQTVLMKMKESPSK